MVPESPSERQAPGEGANGSAAKNSKLRCRGGDHLSVILLQLLLPLLLQEQSRHASGARQHQPESCINFKLGEEVSGNLYSCIYNFHLYERFRF